MILSFAIAVIFGYYDKPLQMSITIVFFLFYGILSIIEKLDYFKLSKEGISVKLKQLDNDINSIKEILNLFGELSLTALAYTGNWGGPTISDKEKIKDDFVKKLESKNISDSEIDTILVAWHKYVIQNYYGRLLNHVAILAQKAGNNELDSFNKEFNIEKKPNIAHIKTFCSAHNLHSEILDNLLSDLEYYEKNKSHRSIENWLSLVS